MVHLLYPNAVMNIVILLATIMLCAMTMQNKKMKSSDRDISKGN